MFKRVVVMVLAASMMCAGTSFAAVVGTQQALTLDARQTLINSINHKLHRSDVRQAMIDLGVNPAEAEQRVASLSDSELAELDGRMSALPAGSGALALVGAVFVILLILDLTGVINIFSNT